MNCVVIPTYRAATTISDVVERVGSEITLIVVVDDCCPENSGEILRRQCRDPRVLILKHDTNQGVGGAFLTGMAAAIDRGASIIVKIDADGQIDPALIPGLIRPILNGQADFAKGNRFFFLSNSASMPWVRLFGNLCLSFMTKISSGYWTIMDPTNGFIAIHAKVALLLVPSRISKRFFFETDLLFHVGLLRAKVVEFPMKALYGGETSNLRVSRILGEFMRGHFRNTARRLLYRYFIHDFSIASIELLVGVLLFSFGLIFGTYNWIYAASAGVFASTGTIMLAAVSLLIGFQLILAFLNYDINSVPREPLHPILRNDGEHFNKAERLEVQGDSRHGISPGRH